MSFAQCAWNIIFGCKDPEPKRPPDHRNLCHHEKQTQKKIAKRRLNATGLLWDAFPDPSAGGLAQGKTQENPPKKNHTKVKNGGHCNLPGNVVNSALPAGCRAFPCSPSSRATTNPQAKQNKKKNGVPSVPQPVFLERFWGRLPRIRRGKKKRHGYKHKNRKQTKRGEAGPCHRAGVVMQWINPVYANHACEKGGRRGGGAEAGRRQGYLGESRWGCTGTC